MKSIKTKNFCSTKNTIKRFKTQAIGAPGWLNQLSIHLLISAQVMISQFVSSSPKSGFALTVRRLLGILSLSLSFCFLMFIYFGERERDRVQVGKGQRERDGDSESKAGSRLQAVSTEPNVGLIPTNHEIMT